MKKAKNDLLPFLILGFLELIQNHLKPDGIPLDFWYCEAFYQLDRTAVLFSIVYQIWLKLFSKLQNQKSFARLDVSKQQFHPKPQ